MLIRKEKPHNLVSLSQTQQARPQNEILNTVDYVILCDKLSTLTGDIFIQNATVSTVGVAWIDWAGRGEPQDWKSFAFAVVAAQVVTYMHWGTNVLHNTRVTVSGFLYTI